MNSVQMYINHDHDQFVWNVCTGEIDTEKGTSTVCIGYQI